MSSITTVFASVALGAIFGANVARGQNTSGKIVLVSLFSAVGVIVSAIFVDPLLNATVNYISRTKDEKKLLHILTKNKPNNTNSYIVPQLNLSGDYVNIDLTLSYVQQVLCPIVNDIQEALLSNNDRTVFIGIVGSSGSGKTTLSQLLVRSLTGLNIPSVTISMDNYHYTNEYLDSKLHSYRKDEKGMPITLRKVKGRSETIDSKSMLNDLKKVATIKTTKEKELLLPLYDRALHDPVPNQLIIPNVTRVVLVEGLHLLRDFKSKEEFTFNDNDDEYWIDIRSMFTTLYYLRFDDYEVQKERVMQRRIRGGISREWASPRYDEIDAVVGIEIENECKRVITNVNEKNNIVVMSMFEDEDGHVQLKRKQVYNSGLQIVEKKEPTISESIKGMIFFVSFVYLLEKINPV
jgi:pantothenate kinase